MSDALEQIWERIKQDKEAIFIISNNWEVGFKENGFVMKCRAGDIQSKEVVEIR